MKGLNRDLELKPIESEYKFADNAKFEAGLGSGNFWLSIKPKHKCLFSRRNGYFGKLIFGYSVCLRLFGKDIL